MESETFNKTAKQIIREELDRMGWDGLIVVGDCSCNMTEAYGCEMPCGCRRAYKHDNGKLLGTKPGKDATCDCDACVKAREQKEDAPTPKVPLLGAGWR